MKISDSNGYLEIRRTEDKEFPYLRIAASIQTNSGKFTGENNGVIFGGGEVGKEQLQKLISFQTNDAVVDLTEGCRIEIHRLPRGNMEVRFVITVYRSGSETSIRSLISVEGEYALNFVEALYSEIA